MMKKLLSKIAGESRFGIDLGLLTIRLFFGFAMAFAHGLGKVPVSEQFLQGVIAIGMPMPLFFAWAAALSELLGGICLALGLLTRVAAFFLLNTMVVAAFIVHSADPFQKKELALAYGAVALGFLLAGGGRYSLDSLLKRPRIENK